MSKLIIAGREFSSRLFLGTGKFNNNELMARAIEASATEMVTVAMKRVELDDQDDELLTHITRFPNIRMEYAIEDRDFSVPPLSVQPLVENAIRHGVRIRREGLVQVSTRREARAHVITVRDNGRGFVPAKLENLDSSHLGIRNVRERVESMCGGTLQIDSAEGEGTVVTIRLPAKEL